MKTSFSNLVVIVLMLVTFIDQSFASAPMAHNAVADKAVIHTQMVDQGMVNAGMPCHAEAVNSQVNARSGDSKRADVKPADAKPVDANVGVNNHHIGCCGQDCECDLNACGAQPFLNTSIGFAETPLASDAVILPFLKHAQAITTSLFRPPIIA